MRDRLSLQRELRELGLLSGADETGAVGAERFRDLEIVPPDDRRYRSDTLAVPYRWVCSIEVYRKNARWGKHGEARWLLHGKGTGVLIGSDCVLTAAHVLWREEKVDRVVVIPARDRNRKPFGRIEAATWRTAAGWDVRLHPRRWDFALIRLSEAIGNKSFRALNDRPLGWWGNRLHGGGTSLKPLKADWLNGRRVFSSGYPGDRCGTHALATEAAIQRCARDEPDLWASTQWCADGRVQTPDNAPGLLRHTIDTREGQSGSPLWYSWRDPKRGQILRWLVGLHVDAGATEIDPKGNARQIDNLAVWISKGVLDEIARLRR
jgi:V8-like Glu-specific endopeptidase